MYIHRPKFGKYPTGDRLSRIQQSSNYRDGCFQNLEYTPSVSEGYSIRSVALARLFTKVPHIKPDRPIPSQKTDLHNLDIHKNILVRFGHSSYFMQIDGKRFLIDPIFSGNASPIPRSAKAFPGTDRYTVADMPDIDYLLITHDHYDHLDYATILALQEKVKKVIVGLGVGAHFAYWGYPPEKIIEKDRYEELVVSDDIKVITAPARHFSGRSLKRSNTLWMSYILKTANKQVYLGGDSGYGAHFQEINRKYGKFDLVILDNGQYNVAREPVHMVPSDVLQAAKDLQTSQLLPVHSSKFALALHPRNEPLKMLSYLYQEQKPNFKLLTPLIGQIVDIDDTSQKFEQRWV